MPFIEHDLKTLLETMPHPFLQSEVKTLMMQLLSAVAHCHSNWIVSLLKPFRVRSKFDRYNIPFSISCIET
jgi:serine/threonine protein kinase